MSKPNSRGFTLIELLVVIAIIGLLSSVVLVALSSARSRARDSQRVSALVQIRTALEVYRSTYNSYPNLGAVFTSNIQTAGTINYTGSCGSLFAGSPPSYALVSANNLVPGLVPQSMATFPTDPSGATPCLMYTSNGTDYKLLEWNVLENTNVIASSSPFYDSAAACPSCTISLTRASVYSPNAAPWILYYNSSFVAP